MLTDLTIAQAAEGLRKKEFSAVELTKAHTEAVEALNGRVNAYITITSDKALAAAKKPTARWPLVRLLP